MLDFSAKNIQTLEELRDVYQHFLLYYGTEVPKMKAHMRAKKKAEKASGEGGGEEDGDDDDDQEQLKQATRKTGYTMCVQAGLGESQCLGVFFKFV